MQGFDLLTEGIISVRTHCNVISVKSAGFSCFSAVTKRLRNSSGVVLIYRSVGFYSFWDAAEQ